MRELWRRRFWEIGGSAIQLVLLIIGAQFESPSAWVITLAAVALISLPAWVVAWRHVSAVVDTPTSKVVSAAQGYAELQGTGRPFDGPPLCASLSLTPCLWYRFQIEQRKGDKWETRSRGESDASFLLDDGTSQCAVDPEGAQVITDTRKQWTQGDERYTEWLITDGQPVYALGEFITRGSADLALNVNEDVKLMLADWKQDPQRLNERFDLNGDGQLDMREWDLARAQARREVLAVHREAQAHAEAHIMQVPHDGRLYLIATIPPEKIVLRYRLWAGFHLLCFFAALGGIGCLLPQL